MWFDLGDYLKPTPSLNELRILTLLKNKPDSSQAGIAEAIGLVPAMVNTYIRRFCEAGLVTSVHHSAKRVEYDLTPAGERRRSYHLISFLSQTYSLFDQVMNDLRERIDAVCSRRNTKVVIYGAGETGRMVYLAIQSLSHVNVIGVIDDDPQKMGKRFFSLKIEGPETLEEHYADCVLIASWRYSDEMAGRIESVALKKGIDVARLIP